MFEKNSYIEDIQKFKKILSSEADKLLSTEDLSVVYIGRETCPFCRKFAKKLSGLTDKINTTIYYVDSQDSSDDNLKTFRSKYNIVTVPGFIVRKNNEVEVRCDSSTPEDEILDMLNK
ncbi:MAG: thioredoxin domain-containing protein [Clostridium sp.]|uniref:thioredoxin domain-containing protein n=1 Tax=Clostridium sp. TaxID=1506 RepID=UPI002907F223|nr:thioredoxin domain-containing protein [Clostridium sp.]MDU5109378.1 thioredoxin domain-containing protein [Clostridium sp.]